MASGKMKPRERHLQAAGMPSERVAGAGARPGRAPEELGSEGRPEAFTTIRIQQRTASFFLTYWHRALTMLDRRRDKHL